MIENIRKEVTVTEERIISKRIYCDTCRKLIIDTSNTVGMPNTKYTQYWEVTTGHYDWGNDSCDSIETYQYCSRECLTKAINKYIDETEGMRNTQYFEIHNRRA